ncbi:MAG: NADH-quinone oxidoreductase subunit L [Coriobacteriia bacterium]|nr:NADH-quinone oxidoreductase subunit L [Coriobacteriia bacterium]
MSALLGNPWIAVIGPFVLAGLLALFGRTSRTVVPWVASLGPLAVVAIGVRALMETAGAEGAVVEPWTSAVASTGSMTWFQAGEMSLSLGWSIDSLAGLMLIVVGVVALMVMIFSVGYMAGDRGWVRYYALLSMFTGSMTLLVIGDSFTALFVGWELVGACSYLLIGFWYEKPSAAAAAIKAFLTTRIGDLGLLVGIAVLWKATGSLQYAAVVEALPEIAPATITIAAILVAVGAIGKSAQFPLHIWLPDAMEGPTPVSALIHAATMVAAGVYLVARTWPLFGASETAQSLLLAVGVISALGAALIAVPQRDIKKVLAYSTISQLGFMFAALGAGKWEVAFFHLVAHAAFKALLFLASGSVIHGSGTQDLAEMGGLRTSMPVTFGVWLIGAGALVGIWPLAGFFSKDAVLDAVWLDNPVAGVALFVTVLLTAYYTMRATKLAFFGTWRGTGHAHESPVSMLAPLVILAVPAALLGFGAGAVSTMLGEHPEPLSLPLSAAALTLGALGLVGAWVTVKPEAIEGSLTPPHGVAGVLFVGFGYDSAIMRWIVGPTVATSRGVWAVVDRFVIDGIVEGSALATKSLARVLSRSHSGGAQSYATLMAIGMVLMICALLVLGRWAG